MNFVVAYTDGAVTVRCVTCGVSAPMAADELPGALRRHVDLHVSSDDGTSVEQRSPGAAPVVPSSGATGTHMPRYHAQGHAQRGTTSGPSPHPSAADRTST